MVTFLIIAAGLTTNAKLVSILSDDPKEKDAENGKITPATQKKALENAELEKKKGNYKLAIVHLENAKLYPQAMELAESSKEYLLAARLSLKMNNRSKARDLYLLGKDFRTAAHLSNLLGEPSVARDYYRKEFREKEKSLDLRQKADLMDRFWDHESAAKLYEEVGELLRGADALEESGRIEEAQRLREHLEVIESHEKRKQGEQKLSPTILEHRRKAAETSAALLESEGDYFEAAWQYRKLDQFAKAATLYEKLEEWLKAALCWEKSGDKARAENCINKVPPRDIKEAAANPKVSGRMLTPPPKPSSASPNFPFRPSSSGVAKPPVESVGPPIKPKLPQPELLKNLPPFRSLHQNASLMRLIFPHQYWEQLGISEPSGAETKTPQEYLKLAGMLALKGALVSSADVYLQMGKIRESIDCLRDAKLRRIAGMLAICSGENVRAVELLIDEITDDPEPGICFVVAQVFLKLGDSASALRLLRMRLAPTIKAANADHVYRFGRLLEEADFLQDAFDVYADLVNAGATSADLEKRLADLRNRIKQQETTGTGRKPYDPSDPSFAGLSETQKKIGAWHFISKMITDDEEDEVQSPPVILAPGTNSSTPTTSNTLPAEKPPLESRP
ncbi:MAG: hypothetical protein SFY68_07735, partial [Candidatus Sumerlaeia bacterium]|nr:hypothetical protein [Candidatus Sumerlaeia bacterium]